MQKFIATILAVLFLTAAGFVPAHAKSLRESLVAMKTSKQVIPLDEYTTVFEPKLAAWGLFQSSKYKPELYEVGKQYGQWMVKTSHNTNWVPITVKDLRSAQYLNPDTNEPGWLFEVDQPEIKIDGVANIERFYYPKRGNLTIAELKYIIITHHKPQPMVSKNEGRSAYKSQPLKQSQPKPMLPTEELAMKVTKFESNFTMRNNPTELMEGKYLGMNSSGESKVAIETYFAPEGTNQRRMLDTKTYAVKNGHLSEVESDLIPETLLPAEVENLVASVAQDARLRGSSAAQYQDYTVTGKALRDERKCDVDIFIFKGEALANSRVVNGCNVR